MCLNSGVSGEYSSLVPVWLKSEADQVFPASCQTTGGSMLPIRRGGNTVWIAPDGTSSFKAGSSMTKAGGSADKIRTPADEGEYRIYVVDGSGKILSKSSHILRVSGSSSGTEAESADYKSGIQTENCSEGGTDVAYIEDGDYIGFKNVDMTGGESIDLRIGSNGAEASLEVRIDSPDGKLIGKMNVEGTGGWQKWATQNCTISPVDGSHDLYFVFRGGDGYLYNLNWWRLNVAETPFTLGDVDNDGHIDSFDLALLREAVSDGDMDDIRASDIDGNGEIDNNDVHLLSEFILGNITSFPKD